MGRETWSNRLMYVTTVAGATIGFGATWRFPYLVGQNGGGAYLLIFLAAMVILGIPMLMAESVIGRRLHKNVINSFGGVDENGKKIHRAWKAVGYLGIFGAFAIMAYYMVLGAFVIAYIVGIINGSLNISSPIHMDVSSSFFENSILKSGNIILYTIIFILLNYYILIKGVIKGIERSMKYLMPLFLVIVIIMIIRSVTLDGAREGIIFYLKPDFSKINAQTFLLALGQVFFALSIGFGVIITLASYLSKSEDIAKTSMITGLVNTIIPFLIGFIIFPSIFAFGLDPASGTSLVFKVLPIVFSNMWFGSFFAVLFFSLLLIAALTSSLSIYEVIVTTLTEKLQISRKKATFIVVGAIFLLGNIPSVMAYGSWSHITFFGLNIFDSFDYLSANILFILTSFCSAIFIGFVLKNLAVSELTNNGKINRKWALVWFNYVKYIVPILIVVLFVISF